MLRLIFSAVLLALLSSAGVATAEGVALTFDDLRTMSLSDAATYAAITTRELLAGLRRHHLMLVLMAALYAARRSPAGCNPRGWPRRAGCRDRLERAGATL